MGQPVRIVMSGYNIPHESLQSVSKTTRAGLVVALFMRCDHLSA